MTSHAMLMRKLKDIEAATGVKSKEVNDKEQVGDQFLMLKHVLADGIHRCLADVRERNQIFQKYGGSKETIEKSASIRDQVRALEKTFEELKRVQLQQAKKVKKFGEEEIQKRAKQVHLFAKHLADLKEAERHGTNLKLALPTITDGRKLLLGGANGMVATGNAPGARRGFADEQERDMNDDEIKALDRFKRKDQELDEMIDDIDKGVMHLGELATQIQDTLEKQEVMIDTVNKQADVTGDHMNNINKKMKKTLQQVRSADRFCVDIICIVILLAMAGYCYNMLSKK